MHRPEPSTKVRLRPATDQDGPAIGRLIANIYAEYEGCLYDPKELPELDAFASHYGNKGGCAWVAEAHQDIIGCCAISRVGEEPVYQLHKVYLAAEWRGSGLAESLIAQACSFAREKGGQRIVLFSDTRFRRGHAFYEKLGWRRLAGLRNLNDLSRSLEYYFTRTITAR